MGLNSKELCLVEILNQLQRIDQSLKKRLGDDKKILMAIYDLLSKRFPSYEKIKPGSIEEVDDTCKKMIERYNQFIALMKGNFDENDISDTWNSFIIEVESISSNLEKEIELSAQSVSDLSRIISHYSENPPAVDNHPGYPEHKIESMPILRGESEPNQGIAYGLFSVLNHRFSVYTQVLSDRRESLKMAVDNFTVHFNFLLRDFYAYRNLHLSLLKERLNDIPKNLTINGKPVFQDSLRILTQNLLVFLQYYNIEIMTVIPGEKYNHQRHRKIRGVKTPDAHPHLTDTVLQVQSSGFMKGGQPFYPARVLLYD